MVEGVEPLVELRVAGGNTGLVLSKGDDDGRSGRVGQLQHAPNDHKGDYEANEAGKDHILSAKFANGAVGPRRTNPADDQRPKESARRDQRAFARGWGTGEKERRGKREKARLAMRTGRSKRPTKRTRKGGVTSMGAYPQCSR